MKKLLILALGAGMFTVTADAQPFKQVGKENNLQVLFAPLGNNPFSLNDNTLMYRKFNATGTSAFRIGLNIGSSTSTNVLFQAADTIFDPAGFADTLSSTGLGYTLVPGLNPQADQTNKTFSFTLRPGYEMHFAGTDRLSPYWGAEIIFTKTSTKSETDQIVQGPYSVTVTDTFFVAEPDVYVNNSYTPLTLNQKSGSTTFGINLIAGFDFYFAKNLSIGGEISFGYSRTSFSDLETEFVNTPQLVIGADTNNDPNISTMNYSQGSSTVASAPDQKQGSSSGFGPGVVGQIKVGWLF